MKKLFLQDGKLMVGEFPEEPTSWGQEDSQYYGCVRDEYHKAVLAAKASAVEVVNPTVMTPEVWYSIKDGILYDMPTGWTVEIFLKSNIVANTHSQLEDSSTPSSIKKFARLIPLKEQSSGITYMHDRNCRRYKDEGTYCQEHCYFKDSGLKECPSKSQSSGIAAVGVPEYGPLAEEYIGTWMIKENDIPQVHRQLDKILGVPEYGKGWEGEKLDLLQHHETIATDSAGIPESGEKQTELDMDEIEELVKHHQSRIDYYRSRIAVLRGESVSPPPQATESEVLAGASFAEKEKTLEYKLAIATSAVLKEALDKLEALQEELKIAKKEAHNAAIEKVTESLQRRVEFGHLEIDWEYVVQELDKLKI